MGKLEFLNIVPRIAIFDKKKLNLLECDVIYDETMMLPFKEFHFFKLKIGFQVQNRLQFISQHFYLNKIVRI